MSEDLPGGFAEIAEALFDRNGYLQSYPDVGMSGLDPLEHFLCIGRYLGRDPGFDFDALLSGTAVQAKGAPFCTFGLIQHDPLISILVVSFNSSKDLEVLFRSIAAQTYVHYEVVLVENGEEDTEPLLRSFFPEGRFLRADNVGFAAGNNLALEMSRGELVALVNPDTRLAFDMLQNLLEGMRHDGQAAVVVPRICFFERFVQLRIRADVPFKIERAQILEGLAYRKLFVTQGRDEGDTLLSDEDGCLGLYLPYENARRVSVALRAEKPVSFCETRIDYARPHRTMRPADDTFFVDIDFDAANCANARFLVNNAGSMFRADGTPFDRGFAEFDDGRFLAKCYVDALCGCAALIRRTAILNRTLFFGPSFAYYEDTELSRWLMRQNYRILYEPSAQVFHRHSESTNEHSLAWQVLVGRGRQIYETVIQGPDADLSDFSINYPEAFAGPLRAKLEAFDAVMREGGSPKALTAPVRRTACVYDKYFNSMGGGEKHALDIASLLRADYDVYLASESEFDIGDLEVYFDLDLSGVRKIVSDEINTHFTSKFDLFVNCTFLSELLPAAKHNLYVVSFPQRRIAPHVASQYRFLHNSTFTSGWAQIYWGHHASKTVLPLLGQHMPERTALSKEKVLLSVGRFTYGGHCKNHLLVVAAFVSLIKAGRIASDWRLDIVGSCDLSDQEAVNYHNDLIAAAQGWPVTILANAERAQLGRAYARAAIYVHAAGLGFAPDRPELHEHFGISVFEAMMNGCIPIVYHIGGPAQQVAGLSVSGTFADTEEMEEAIFNAVFAFEAGDGRHDEVRNHATRMIDGNMAAFQDMLASIIATENR